MTGSCLKIEMVLPTLVAAGMEVVVARMARALAARGHDVGVTCLESGGVLADDLRESGFRVTIVRAPGIRSIVYAPRLETWFRGLRPDVVHVHSGVWHKAARAARRAGAPRVIHTAHGLLDREPWFGPALMRLAARYTDRIATVSHPLRKYLVDVVRIRAAKVVVVPNGVSTDRFCPRVRNGALRGALQLADDALVIGSVARLAPVKNHSLLLDAFALVRAHVPNAHLVLVGDGALRHDLEAHARTLRLDSFVHFVGEADDVASIYQDFDQFALASKAEGTSMSVLEAMASGVPVVATAVGGTPELLDHGRSGVLVPPEDAGALAGALIGLLQDAGRRRTLASAARQRVVDRYSERAMLAAYEALYRGNVPESAVPHENPGSVSQCVA